MLYVACICLGMVIGIVASIVIIVGVSDEIDKREEP
jgi:hypothetical protein